MIKKIKENWYFIKQDITSYLISTLEYLTLCIIRNYSIYSVSYGLFDCLVFYFPFWFIRICFAETYHSNKWKHCKKWTRIMLCSGVFVMWILPIKYSLFNGLFVAFLCCLILYLVALEVNEKKEIKRYNKKLELEIEKLIAELKIYKNIDLYKMTETELRAYAQSKGLSETICDTLILRIIHNYRWVDIERAKNFTKRGIDYHKEQIIKKLGFKP